MSEDLDILALVRQAAAKRVLFLPHAVRQMSRPDRLQALRDYRITASPLCGSMAALNDLFLPKSEIRRTKLRMALSGKRITTSVLAQLFLLTIYIPINAQQNTIKISTPEEIKAEFSSVPCKDDDRLIAVQALFEKVGVSATDISVEKYQGVENLVVRKPGTLADIIVVGAHYDKAANGCGVIDNWTGIVAIAHLYRTLKNASLRKTIIFVAFGKEEKGLVGSRAMVDAIAKDQLGQYCAMINIDSLGLSAPQVLDNASSKKLRDLAATAAQEMKIPFSHASVGNADSDSSSFVRKKIPALTIHGLNNQWSSIIHSRHDQISKVNPSSVYLGYRLALALLSRLDASSCATYR